MTPEECARSAANHLLTKGAVRVAVQKVRGRVGSRPLGYDSRFTRLFLAFAEKISVISLAPTYDDVSYVGTRENWRQLFADDAARRLRENFSHAYARCFPDIGVQYPNLELNDFVHLSARFICEDVFDATPSVGIMCGALWGIANVSIQVARCLSADLDPMILPHSSGCEPVLPALVPLITFPQPQDCN